MELTNKEEIKEMLERGYTAEQIHKITGCEINAINEVEEELYEKSRGRNC